MTKLNGFILPAIFIFLFIAVFIFGSCKASKPEEQIIGQWELSEEFDSKGIRIPYYIEFFSDGSVQSEWGGKYSVDGNKLNIYYAAMDSYSYTFDINDNMLTLKSDIGPYNNDETEYTYFRSESAENNADKTETQEDAEPKLSDECDAVLAEGTDINGDYYELVATQEDTYNSTVIKLGVIKNNKWLVELSNDNPFIDEESGLLWSYDYYTYSYNYCTTGLDGYDSYSFIGNGCFYHYGLFYNADTQKYYKDDYVLNGEMHARPNEYIIPYTFYRDNDTENTQKLTDAENIILELRNDDICVYELLNTTTMTMTDIGTAEDFYVEAPFSEGLFLGSKDDKYAFYNSKGEKVIDLSEYNITTWYLTEESEGIFIDGKATISVQNDAGKRFKITIDKTGNMISQELIENQ